MQASSDPFDPRAVLGAVKAQPGNAGASRKPSATAGLDRPCARRDRRSAGRDEGTGLGSNTVTARYEEQAIAPAVPPVPHFPRFRALALFGRRPQERVDSIVMPASENLHMKRLMHRSK